MNTNSDFATVMGVILIVSAIVFAWAMFIRKPKKKRRHHKHRDATPEEPRAAAPFSPARKARRRKRRSEAKANPTLAETRGLPPVREDHRAVAEHYQN